MKRKYFSALLMGALTIASVKAHLLLVKITTMTSAACKSRLMILAKS